MLNLVENSSRMLKSCEKDERLLHPERQMQENFKQFLKADPKFPISHFILFFLKKRDILYASF